MMDHDQLADIGIEIVGMMHELGMVPHSPHSNIGTNSTYNVHSAHPGLSLTTGAYLNEFPKTKRLGIAKQLLSQILDLLARREIACAVLLDFYEEDDSFVKVNLRVGAIPYLKYVIVRKNQAPEGLMFSRFKSAINYKVI